MSDWLSNFSAWLGPLGRTFVSVGLAYVIGLALRDLVVARLVRMASRTRSDWDDILAAEVKRRVPFWSFLFGAWIALRFWQLGPAWEVFYRDALFVAVGASVTLAVSSVATRLVTSYGARVAPALPVTSLTQNLARAFILTLGLLIVLRGLHIDITTTLAALGVGGLAVALALQEPLSNLFAGLFVTLAGQVRIGDYVRLDSGSEGYILDFNWRSTRLQALRGNVVVVPNSKLSQAIVTNYSLPALDIAIALDVGVDYDSDLSEVERVVCDVGRDVMRSVPGGVPDFDPIVRFHTFGSSSIDFTVILRGREFVDQYLVKHEFVKMLHVRFKKEGIVIPFPIRTLASRDPIPVSMVSTRG